MLSCCAEQGLCTLRQTLVTRRQMLFLCGTNEEKETQFNLKTLNDVVAFSGVLLAAASSV